MPYSGKSDASLPSHVKAMDDNARSQWVQVFNSVYAKCSDEGTEAATCEGTAMQQANGVAKGEKSYVGSWNVEERQLSHDAASYSPTGGITNTDGRACAGCQWFVSPDGCVVVGGEISPTGLSSMYQARVVRTPEPIPVTIVGGERAVTDGDGDYDSGSSRAGDSEAASADKKKKKRARQKALITAVSQPSGVRALLAKIMQRDHDEPSPIVWSKQADGRIRYFMVSTNCFKDREGQIITTAAHKEFVDWAEAQAQAGDDAYPELWLWHAPGSRIGKADWMDVCSGMRCTSGLIDADKEYMLDALDAETLGASHGFHGVLTKAGHIIQYRSYEDSLLPLEEAANLWTLANFVEESTMPFSEKRKSWLTDLVGNEDAVGAYERAVDSLSESLKVAGIAYKSVDDPTEEEEAARVAAAEQAAAEQAKMFVGELTNVTSAIKSMAEVLGQLTTKQVEQDARLVELSKSDDEKMVAALTSKVNPGTGAGGIAAGHVASASADNVVGAQQKSADDDWFGSMVIGPALSQIGGGVR